ncbi:transmembrane protein 187-like [Babylonia areolata]|uniref:transmembrane protein 187-like n=1 Tax=Babylonia areolata TaxID=304850 RepID=UPI003FD19117
MAVSGASTERQKLSTQCSSSTVTDIFQQASVTLLVMTLVMVLITWSGTFDTATVELGLEHYAEQRPPWLPDCVPMPLNTAINFGYMLCGGYWCLVIQRAHVEGTVKDADTYFFFVFNGMGFVYGFVQLYRIVAQTVGSAVMDQWYTFPFFMLVYAWAQSVRGRCSRTQFYALMCVSVTSYSLTLLTPVGFELSLGCHILLAVVGASFLYKENSSDRALQNFLLGVLNCCGFVVLKLMDHHLPHAHWIFNYVSGHFLSKICDVLQFHYVSKFFFTIVGSCANAVMKEEMKSR